MTQGQVIHKTKMVVGFSASFWSDLKEGSIVQHPSWGQHLLHEIVLVHSFDQKEKLSLVSISRPVIGQFIAWMKT